MARMGIALSIVAKKLRILDETHIYKLLKSEGIDDTKNASWVSFEQLEYICLKFGKSIEIDFPEVYEDKGEVEKESKDVISELQTSAGDTSINFSKDRFISCFENKEELIENERQVNKIIRTTSSLKRHDLVRLYKVNWPIYKYTFNGRSIREQATEIFDSVICELLNVENGLSKIYIGGLLGFTIDELGRFSDDVEASLLEKALDRLLNLKIVIGDSKGYFIKSQGRKLATRGWMPEERSVSFSYVIDPFTNIASNLMLEFGKVMIKENSVQQRVLDLCETEFGEHFCGMESSLDYFDIELEQSVSYDDVLFFLNKNGLSIIEKRDSEDGNFKYIIKSDLVVNAYVKSKLISHDFDSFREVIKIQSPTAHDPENRIELLGDPLPEVKQVEVYQIGINIAVVQDKLNDDIKLVAFNSSFDAYSEYLTDSINQESIKNEFYSRLQRDSEAEEKFSKDGIFDTETTKEVEKSKSWDKEIISQQGKTIGDEKRPELVIAQSKFGAIQFEDELDKLFESGAEEIWLNFPRLRNRPLKQRIDQFEKALKKGTKVFLGFSSDYANLDNNGMHDTGAKEHYEKLSEKYNNFFLCEIGSSHVRHILVKSKKEKYMFIPSYNIMSFTPLGYKGELAREVVYRRSWDDIEYDEIKRLFIETLFETSKEKFIGFKPEPKYIYNKELTASKNLSVVKEAIDNIFSWVEILIKVGKEKDEYLSDVNKYLIDSILVIGRVEFFYLKDQISNCVIDNVDERLLYGKRLVGRIHALVTYLKNNNLDKTFKGKDLLSSFYLQFPELKNSLNKNKSRGKVDKPRKINLKKNNKKK